MHTSSLPLRILLAGSGRVAGHLAEALQENGHIIAGVVSRTADHAKRLGERMGAPWYDLSPQVLPPAEVVIYAVSDQALEEVIETVPPGRMLALHTSGSLPLDIFREKAENYGVLYPLQTFTEGRQIDFREIPLCIEANTPENEERLQALAVSLSRRVVHVNSEQRITLHLAAVLVNNFVNHLFVVADELLQQKNLPFDLLQPLMEETVAKALSMGPEKAQTGPAARNDENVIKKHLDLLSWTPGRQKIYRLLTESILDSMHPQKKKSE